MIVIESIKTMEVDRDEWEIYHYGPTMNRVPCNSECMESVTSEMIRGRTFVNAHGRRVCIGMSKQVQDAIGLPARAFENMSEHIENSNILINAMKKRIESFQNMNLLGRILFVFGYLGKHGVGGNK